MRNKLKRSYLIFLLIALAVPAGWVLAQFPPRPPMPRPHQITQSGGAQLVPATVRPPGRNKVKIKVVRDQRIIESNGVPDHKTGPFPNRGNPHQIGAQSYLYHVPAEPKEADQITPLGMQNFGISVHGIPFDPGAAEWYRGDPQGGWQYEALSGAVPLGLDANHAHVQPTGAYHYHGLPTSLLKELRVIKTAHSPIIGWAADGFPIYALYAYEDPEDSESKIVVLKSSYRLKKGNRPAGANDPGGTYDGTFTADYEYVEDAGDLDECNGRYGKTPDYPEGTYAYFLTNEWPVIPRNYRGTPSEDFRRRRGPPGPPR